MEMTETRAEGMTPQAQRRMTPDDYERERQRIKTIYGDSTAEAGAQRDQALAALYHRTGWTIEELAEKEKIGKSRIAQKLLFGRFLGFSTSGGNSSNSPRNLNERRFRSYWERTEKGDGNERIRFQAVLRLMEEETILRKPTAPKFEVGAAIMAEFADGKWHKLATIEAHVHEQTEAAAKEVQAVLSGMVARGNYGSHCEQKQVGTSHAYRIVRKSGKSVDVDVLTKELEPLLLQLEVEGKKNNATASPSTVAYLVFQLRALIEKLTK